jgi:hypothetical protein
VGRTTFINRDKVIVYDYNFSEIKMVQVLLQIAKKAGNISSLFIFNIYQKMINTLNII